MSKTAILNTFKDQLKLFVDDLISKFQYEPDLILLRLYVTSIHNVEDIITYMIQNIIPYKEQIINRDIKFITDNKTIETDVSNNGFSKYMNSIKSYWFSETMTEEDRLTIWKWLNVFVVITEKYMCRI